MRGYQLTCLHDIVLSFNGSILRGAQNTHLCGITLAFCPEMIPSLPAHPLLTHLLQLLRFRMPEATSVCQSIAHNNGRCNAWHLPIQDAVQQVLQMGLRVCTHAHTHKPLLPLMQ